MTFSPNSHNKTRNQDFDICPDKPLNPNRLTVLLENFEQLCLSDRAWEKIHFAHNEFVKTAQSQTPIYGETTGFGPFVRHFSGHGGNKHARHLLAHLGAGSGEDSPDEVVRAAMILRLNALVQGYSGTSPSIVSTYLKLLQEGYVASVPVTGSVGASGDLIPMASIAGLLAGYGSARKKGERIDGTVVQKELGITEDPFQYGRDALSLVNCTSFSTAWAILALNKAKRLLHHAEQSTAILMALVGARQSSLDPRLHEVKGQIGQIESANNIRAILNEMNGKEDSSRELQEVYSIRCAPQILGAVRDQLEYAELILCREMNSVNDNPVVFEANNKSPMAGIAHGGNFFAQHVAFVSDAINSTITQMGILAERQLDLMVTPSRNNDWPLLLSWQEGAMSGLAGAQIGASALLAEMRAQSQSYANSSVPTNAGNQDIVPMATNAARQSYEQSKRLSVLISTLYIALNQVNALKKAGKIKGIPIDFPVGTPIFEPIIEDRPLREEINKTAHEIWSF